MPLQSPQESANALGWGRESDLPLWKKDEERWRGLAIEATLRALDALYTGRAATLRLAHPNRNIPEGEDRVMEVHQLFFQKISQKHRLFNIFCARYVQSCPVWRDEAVNNHMSVDAKENLEIATGKIVSILFHFSSTLASFASVSPVSASSTVSATG